MSFDHNTAEMSTDKAASDATANITGLKQQLEELLSDSKELARKYQDERERLREQIAKLESCLFQAQEAAKDLAAKLAAMKLSPGDTAE